MVLESEEQLVVAAAPRISPAVEVPPLIAVLVCLSLAIFVTRVMQAL